MLQLQQQQQQQQQDALNGEQENGKHQEEIILEGEGANTIMNPDSVSRIISDGNSDSDESDCKYEQKLTREALFVFLS